MIKMRFIVALVVIVTILVASVGWAHLSSNIPVNQKLMERSTSHYYIKTESIPDQIILKEGEKTEFVFEINSTEPAVFWVGIIDGKLAEEGLDRVLFDSWAYHYHPKIYYQRLEYKLKSTKISDFMIKGIHATIKAGSPITLVLHDKSISLNNVKELYVNGLQKIRIALWADKNAEKGDYRIALVIESPVPERTNETSTEGWGDIIFIDLAIE